MAVSAGDQLGPYQILSLIGEGGMGQVWKARDSRLDRIVAVKVVQGTLTERFEREARAVAALNHPNICQLYDVGPNYLVMEYLEGSPVQGPLPVERAVPLAVQMLDALAAAHAKRIIHRDLKPANILNTDQGIKLLDFGIAKQPAILDDPNATIEAGLTKNGEIAGTLQYMAPERLQGKEGDARSDIFAFGCVLYELLSGKQAFAGTSAANVIAAILERAPAPIPLSSGVEHVIARCLEKDPDHRWQSVRDLKAELVWAAQQKGASVPATAKATPAMWTGWLIAGVLALACAIVVSRPFRPSSAEEVLRLSVLPPDKAPFGSLTATVPAPQFAISPDGGMIAFVAGARPTLWVRALHERNARPLQGTEDAQLPFWSPDGQWIGFFADENLKRIPAGGGPVQAIAHSLSRPYGGSWGPDDTILFADGSEGVARVAASGGQVTRVTRPDLTRGHGPHRWPQFLPDGRHFLFFVRGKPGAAGIYIGSLNGEQRLLLGQNSHAIYARPGYLLYSDGETLFAQRFDPNRLTLDSQAHAVEQGVGRSSTFLTLASVSNAGRLAYSSANLETGRLTWYDRGGTPGGTAATEGDWADFGYHPIRSGLPGPRSM